MSNAHSYFTRGYFAFTGGAVALMVLAMLERRVRLPDKLVLAGIVSVVVLSAFVVPVGASVQQEPIKAAALLCRERNLSPILWRLNAPSFSVYRGQPTEDRGPRPGDVVLTREQNLAQLPGSGYDVLYAKNGIALVRIRP